MVRAIHATIALPGRRDMPRLHVFATHFSPGGAEQRPQVDELVGWTFNHGLGTGDVRDAGWRIAHILVRGLGAHVTSRRIRDAPVTLASGVRATLSDHFGVLADFDARELSDPR